MSAEQLGDAVTEDDMIAQIMSEFSQAFASARMRWTRYAEEVHPELKGAGMLVLQSILRKGPITATELSYLLGMDKAVVSRQVSKLRELELAEAVAAAEDRRVVLLTASDAARAAIEELHAHSSRDYQERFRDWDTVELEGLRAALHRFNSSAPMGGSTPASRCARQ
ncbi:MarR family transcriptional regulator [Leucobacter insecticola]|uniref:MarR family transcriptional regulator n=1 Tax=Leucobacter insecticola TaxID=2714934 RepID=A0A6G8FLA2_9MICO|nr:MarR family transcriptional regulator [Leucobacter insecticola]QIM17145.1 MarR family transcriptional regulator [Leucobacter insecticola]